MKIPETTVNVGAYYGNEENGQWQPNGVIIDNGVGGGVVGSGDAGIHRGPVYPVHIPRGQMPGYVVAGAYYPPAGYPPVAQQPPDDFADYMWMENEEEFDKQVMQQLEEEALMEQCIEAMLEDEQRERHNRPMANGHKQIHYPTTSNGGPSVSMEETVSRSTLNPLAAEFYPTRVRPVPPAHHPHSEGKQEHPAAQTEEVQQSREEQPHHHHHPPTTEVNVDPRTEVTEEPKADALPPQKDPPEVSAANVQPIQDKVQDKRPKDSKKDTTAQTKPRIENKAKTTKTEVKRTKPQAAKSETIIQVKKDVRAVKSEVKVEVKDSDKVKENDKAKVEAETVRCDAKVVEREVAPPVVVAEIPKVQPSQPEEQQQPNTGFKPINYAAAAKANKPKKPSPPLVTPIEKSSAPPPSATKTTKTIDKKDKRPEKIPAKDKPIVQRKNSVK